MQRKEESKERSSIFEFEKSCPFLSCRVLLSPKALAAGSIFLILNMGRGMKGLLERYMGQGF